MLKKESLATYSAHSEAQADLSLRWAHSQSRWLSIVYEPCCDKTCLRDFRLSFDTNGAVQVQKMARGVAISYLGSRGIVLSMF